jgi:hypothetical protein
MKKSIAAVIFCALLPIYTENCRGMVPEHGEPDFITPLGAFINWGCNQENVTDVTQTWALLVTMLKSDNYGGRGCVGGGGNIDMYHVLRDYFKHFQSNGTYDQSSDHETDGILSKYPDFAETFGNTNDPTKPECYYVASKESDGDSSRRWESSILRAIAEDFTLNCDGSVGNTRKANACLQLLLLTELAENSTTNGQRLVYCYGGHGYDQEMLFKFCKLMSVLIEE